MALKDLFGKTSTASILAVCIINWIMAILTGVLFFSTSADTTVVTLIVGGLLNGVTFILGYYYGNSKKVTPTGGTGTTTANISADITTTPTETTDNNATDPKA